MNPVINQMHKTKIKSNTTHKEINSLKKVKNTENIGIHLSDKTNRIIIIDENIVEEKTQEHLHNDKFTKIDYDPSLSIEAEASKILDEISLDPTIDIPPYIFKQLYPQDTTAPSIVPQLKDHKPEFPNCKIRPIQPVTGSAIEKLDILLGKILTQVMHKYSPQFKMPIRNCLKNTP